MSHAFVRSSEIPLLISQRNFGGARTRFETMKNRFPTLHRTGWRQGFVAIARQVDASRRDAPSAAAGMAPRRPVDAAARAEIHVRFAAITSH